MRILIVEDSEKLAALLKKGLESEGYAADIIYDGKSALDRIFLNYQDYDMVILDLMLPEIGGIEICKKTREHKISIPVLMLTAKDTTDDKVIGLNSGADDYLIKPFSFEELLARIKALLRRPKQQISDKLDVKDLVIDLSNKKVTRSGNEISLTLKEFRLLEYFMRNKGKVLTREDIMASLWDFDFNSFSNVVDVHLKNLRKKIDSGYENKLFKTIYGIGYKIESQE
ncbi:MAG: response regulator transcription factor [Actinobacteria bacterium]|nr:response regulator transcription factor [Actinomycetota bacterium]